MEKVKQMIRLPPKKLPKGLANPAAKIDATDEFPRICRGLWKTRFSFPSAPEHMGEPMEPELILYRRRRDCKGEWFVLSHYSGQDLYPTYFIRRDPSQKDLYFTDISEKNSLITFR